MFHLQSLELLHWDYCQRLTLPLDGAIITVAGPNGSGKTTLLDAMRTLLGLDCSGGRNYKTYARHANAETAWLRALVDNRPRTRCDLLAHHRTGDQGDRLDRPGDVPQRMHLHLAHDIGLAQAPGMEHQGGARHLGRRCRQKRRRN